MNNIYKKYDFDSNTTQISTQYFKNNIPRLYIYMIKNKKCLMPIIYI